MSEITRRINSGSSMIPWHLIATGYDLIMWLDRAVEAGQITRRVYERIMNMVGEYNFDELTDYTRGVIDRVATTQEGRTSTELAAAEANQGRLGNIDTSNTFGNRNRAEVTVEANGNTDIAGMSLFDLLNHEHIK